MVSKSNQRIKFLIMEQLPTDGRHVLEADLEQNVSIDARSLNLCYSTDLFDNILTDLVQDQYVVNLEGRVIATYMGLIKSKIL